MLTPRSVRKMMIPSVQISRRLCRLQLQEEKKKEMRMRTRYIVIVFPCRETWWNLNASEQTGRKSFNWLENSLQWLLLPGFWSYCIFTKIFCQEFWYPGLVYWYSVLTFAHFCWQGEDDATESAQDDSSPGQDPDSAASDDKQPASTDHHASGEEEEDGRWAHFYFEKKNKTFLLQPHGFIGCNNSASLCTLPK